MPILDVLMRLIVATICGFAIGSERQIHHRTAGLKTNSLVALGACAFTLFDFQNYARYGTDLRVSAQIVSGIGFIGGGVILKDGFNIKGLTTAATLWCSAAAGMLVGMHYFLEAGIVSMFVMTINTLLRPIAIVMDGVNSEESEYILRMSFAPSSENKIKKILLSQIEKHKLTTKDIKIDCESSSKKECVLDAVILSKQSKKIEKITHALAIDSDINRISWDEIK